MKYLAIFKDIVAKTTGTKEYYIRNYKELQELINLHSGKVIRKNNDTCITFDKAITSIYLIFMYQNYAKI